MHDNGARRNGVPHLPDCGTVTLAFRPQPRSVTIATVSRTPTSRDDHIRLIRIPVDDAAEPRGGAQRPETAGALVRRAAEDHPVVHDEHVIGMPGLTDGIAPGGRHIPGDGLRVVDVGEVDAPEAAFFPGAVDDIAADIPLDIVDAHAVAEPIFRTVRMHVQGRPEPRNLPRATLVAHIDEVHVAERTLAELVATDDGFDPAAGRGINEAPAMRLARQRRHGDGGGSWRVRDHRIERRTVLLVGPVDLTDHLRTA